MQTLTLGDVGISRVVEIGRSSFPTSQMLPESDAGRIAAHHRWLTPHFFDETTGDLGSRIQTWIVRTPRHTVLVDTGVGNDKERGDNPLWNRRTGGLLDDLRAAGVTPEQVDLVLCTHLHVDHVGWNTRLVDGRWLPTFPNARYLLARPEWEHWSADPHPMNQTVLADSVRPIFDAGLVDLVATDHAVDAAISLEPTPGHTPGHVSVHVRSRGEEAVITGDLVHHPAQFARPHWGAAPDWDRALADRTRRAFMERYADTPVLVIGTHFAEPTAGRLVRDGDAYRLDA